MMILAIAVSTMITVAIVVFAMQYCAYRKNHPKRNNACTLKAPASRAQDAPPIAS